jgi:hypothetical protein
VAPSVEGVGPGGNREMPVPEIKAPDRVAVGQTADALADGVVEQYPELEKIFPDPDQPHDLNIVTVVAPFDLADLRRQFRAGDDEGNVIPSSWYDDRPENIVDIVIEREELVEDAWIDFKTLDPIPGQYGFRSELAAGEIDAALRDSVLERLSFPVNQLAVIQPAFYPLRNETLVWPDLVDEQVDEGELEQDEKIKTIRARIKNLERQRDAKLKRLVEDLGGTRREGGAGDDDRGGGPGEGAGRGGDRGGQRGGGQRGGGGRRAPPGKKRDAPGKGGGMGFGAGGPVGGTGGSGRIDEKLEEKLNRQIDMVERKIEAEWQKLRGFGVNVDEEDQDRSVDPLDVLQGDEVVVTGYDLNAEPGHTYSYRVTAKILNPFFGKKRSLVEEQEHLAESFTLDSLPSDWSEPMRINPSLRVFITRASPPGSRTGGPLGKATAEVYRFYDGRHWMESFRVPAGGYIGGVKQVKLPGGEVPVMVDFRTDLFVLDIVADIDDSGGGRGMVDAGPGAKVLLQDIRTGEVLELRDPRKELTNPARRDLKESLALAEDGGGRS